MQRTGGWPARKSQLVSSRKWKRRCTLHKSPFPSRVSPPVPSRPGLLLLRPHDFAGLFCARSRGGVEAHDGLADAAGGRPGRGESTASRSCYAHARYSLGTDLCLHAFLLTPGFPRRGPLPGKDTATHIVGPNVTNARRGVGGWTAKTRNGSREQSCNGVQSRFFDSDVKLDGNPDDGDDDGFVP